MCCCAFPLAAIHGLPGNALTALQKALRQGTPVIHHSDQGVQYAADGYTTALEQRGCV